MTTDALVALIHAAREVEGSLERALAPHGLSLAKYGVIAQLAAASEPLSLTELAGRLSCVRSNITQLVDRLEADGLVRRVDDPEDRRIVRAVLTKVGRERAVAGAAALEAVGSELGTRIAAVDREAFARSLAAFG
jgi:DNA-binding MarR family transcriptional regulator